MAPGCCRLWLQITLHCEPTVHLRKYKQKHKFVFCIWSCTNTNTEVEGSECKLHLIENQLWDWLCCHNCGICQTVSFLQLFFPGNTNLSKKTVDSRVSLLVQISESETCTICWGGSTGETMRWRISQITSTQGRIVNIASTQDRLYYFYAGEDLLYCYHAGEDRKCYFYAGEKHTGSILQGRIANIAPMQQWGEAGEERLWAIA